MFKKVWIVICTIIGAGIGALLLSFFGDSTILTIGATLLGGGVGYLFGKYIPFLSFLSELLN